ncbi:hypothetical protein COCC4DRAFT_65991 [Bipolaris maydis ATCC 48331]|uniref:EthD domain-containing protein n=2 Tax=Cochliobolus heterostrophus TaxID=5016 RepID=M2T881_COCH5|nr:uncharacterized protein COCC4DRAFT_65991 [Bipolaris maydis ATCC 48331]EMD93795.1 hypothetical protein COCHEDRAFT_1132528 [Bipolaris maydis C5]KAH7562684.1 hypothetical protein BM1_02204 [Bipolaris maydis]ENH99911.1 hypothetical protein COCC4DRAFT_65991 [Bipolaris maydis ATCC 48331]KAJ5028071.1 hypothetical protein J3E73DRAFT_380590 [Bipolaris maydis]KAJ5038510.1 hypothetical protein J3E74DRAFT_284742 [Bipolaris maydis]
MTVTVMVFYTRRPEVTPEDFQSHIEQVHLPIYLEVFSENKPLSFTIRYTERVSSGAGDRLGAVTSMTGRAAPDDPVVLIGEPKELGWDAVSEMTFRDELHIQQCLSVMDGSGGERIKEDEDMFAVLEKTKAIIMTEKSVLM